MTTLTLDFDKIDICKKLTHTQRALIKKIHLLSLNEGYCYASNKTLADYVGMSASGIAKVVTRLVELGFITRKITKENGNERHITLTEKTIKMFKKDEEQTEKPKNKGNNIKPKNPRKQSSVKAATPVFKETVEVEVPEVKETFESTFNEKANNKEAKELNELSKTNKLEDLIEAIKRSDKVIFKSARIKYIKSSLKSVIEENNTPKASKKQPKKIIRKEIVPSWLEEYNKTVNVPYNNTPSTMEGLTDEEKLDRMMELQLKLLGGIQ